MTETKKLKAVVAGCGWGLQHMRGFDQSPHAELSAVWARSRKPDAVAAAERFRVPLYDDFEKMMREVGPDVVSIAVPERGHEALTLAALDHGAHVYCEKVLADSREAGQRMVDRAAAVGRQLNVGYNYRYSGSCEYLKKQVDSGAIGQPLFAQLWAYTWCVHHLTDYVGSLLGKPVRAMGRLDLEPLAGKPHKSLHEPGHLFETFAYAAYTKKIYTVEYESGAMLSAASTDYTSPYEPGGRLMIQGDAGRAELDDVSGKVTIWNGEREAKLYTPSQICDPIGLGENGALAVQDFARAIAQGQPAPIPGEQGVAMIALEEAIFRSAKTMQWENIEG